MEQKWFWERPDKQRALHLAIVSFCGGTFLLIAAIVIDIFGW